MNGWRRLITVTVRLAHRGGTGLGQGAVDGRLLCEPVGQTSKRSAEDVRGISETKRARTVRTTRSEF